VKECRCLQVSVEGFSALLREVLEEKVMSEYEHSRLGQQVGIYHGSVVFTRCNATWTVTVTYTIVQA
jgi:hypothetical protein